MADETDVIESDPQAEQALLDMAQSFDQIGQYEMPEEPGQEGEKPPEMPRPEEKPEPKPDEKPEQELKPAAEEKTRDEKGRFLPKPGEKPPETQAESPYTKAQKEEARKTKTWQQIESEKQAVRAEAARIQQERQQFEAQRQAEQARNLPRAQKDGFTAPDYYKASQDFYKEGDFENAYKAMSTANELVAYEQQYYAQQSQKQQEAVVMGQFQADLQKVIQEDPEAAWETQSPVAKEINNVLNQYPYLTYFPEGARRAYEIARLRMEHHELIEARAELEKLRGEITNRDKASQPLRGGPTKPGSSVVNIEDMTEEDMIRMAEAKDAGYG